jgi:hypothetical protein
MCFSIDSHGTDRILYIHFQEVLDLLRLILFLTHLADPSAGCCWVNVVKLLWFNYLYSSNYAFCVPNNGDSSI